MIPAAPEQTMIPDNRLDKTAAPQTSDEAALVSKFSSLVQAPQFLISAFREMELDRRYVSEDAMLLKTQDTVAVNHTLRLQYTSLANLGLTDPQPQCQPTRKVGGIVDPQEVQFAETAEIFLSHLLKQMEFSKAFDGAVQDAMTNPWAILKINVVSDYYKDPIGAPRFADQQDNVARLISLKEQFAAQTFGEDDPLHKEMTDLDNTIRVWMAQHVADGIKKANVPMVPSIDPMTGQQSLVPDPTDPRVQKAKALIDGQEIDLLGASELPYYMGFAVDQILPEDLRWAWTDITRPEDMTKCSWIAHRVYMTADEIGAKFQVRKDLIAGAHLYDERGLYTQRNYLDQDPSKRNPDLEAPQKNERISVWEMWHRLSGRRYVWAQGMKTFLANDVPQAVGHRWYPFFFIYFNRVTGQVLPLSDVKLLRPLQDEVNTLRSHDREARRAAYPSILIGKGLMTPEEKESYRNRYPFSVIEVERAGEIASAFHETAKVDYNPQLFSTGLNLAMTDMQLMAGIPLAAAGAPSGVTATESAIASRGFETGTNRRRISVAQTFTDILWYMLEVSLRIFPEEYVKSICGSMAVWPAVTTEELYNRLNVEVKGGLSGKPDAAKQLDLWKNFAAIAQALMLPVNGVAVLRELLDTMDIRVPVQNFLMIPGMMPGMPMPGAPVGGPPGMPGAPSLNVPGGQGPQGGAPNMADRGPIGPENIPNGPYNKLPPGPPHQA